MPLPAPPSTSHHYKHVVADRPPCRRQPQKVKAPLHASCLFPSSINNLDHNMQGKREEKRGQNFYVTEKEKITRRRRKIYVKREEQNLYEKTNTKKTRGKKNLTVKVKEERRENLSTNTNTTTDTDTQKNNKQPLSRLPRQQQFIFLGRSSIAGDNSLSPPALSPRLPTCRASSLSLSLLSATTNNQSLSPPALSSHQL